MNYKIFSIKDTVTGQFSKPELFVNDMHAVRWFDGICSESKIKGDLQLYLLGTFDIETGDIISEVKFVQGGMNNV